MSQQLIITISRQFGSGGHEVGRLLAQRFSLPLLEENMLRQIAQEKGVETCGSCAEMETCESVGAIFASSP